MKRGEINLGMIVEIKGARFMVVGLKLPDDPASQDVWVILSPWRGNQKNEFWRLGSELQPVKADKQRRPR